MDEVPSALPSPAFVPPEARSTPVAEPPSSSDLERFRRAVDAAGLGAWQHDLRTGVLRLDARAREQYSLDQHEVSAAVLLERVHPDDRAALVAAMAHAFGPDGAESLGIEYRVRGTSGQYRVLHVLVRIEGEGAGAERRAVLAYGTTRDVTALRAAERLMDEQRVLLREVGEIARVGGWDFDPATGEGTWTEETCRIHGLAGTPPLASSGLERFAGDARLRIEAALHEAMTHGTPYDLELPFTAVDGVEKWVRAVCRPVLAGGRVVRVRGTLQDITAQKQSALALSRFIYASPVVVYALAVTPDGLRLVWTGGDLERLTGWSHHEVEAGNWWRDSIHPDDWPRVSASSPVPYDLEHVTIEFRLRKRNGEYCWVRDERRLLRDGLGRPSEVVGSWADVTERVDLEAQLRQAQKMEAIGRLAGGIAHDFNNLLTVIMGNSEMLADSAPAPAAQHMLDEIRHASERALMLTRQLLAFSRKQMLQPAAVVINDEMARLDAMLHRILGEDIAIISRLDPEAGPVLVDPGQFGQVVLNLAVNARDAMPRGGTLRLGTEVVAALPAGVGAPTAPAPHGYVRVTIADTGIGMSPEVQAHIFEPFFTTKPPGQGTGLGLATVFGIVTQSGGAVAVQSAPGAGSCFAVYFPRTVPAAARSADAPGAAGGPETILLVEDDAAVRSVAARVLTRKGYRVIEATGPAVVTGGTIALETVDLLLTDVVMPDMSGLELAQVVRATRPDLKVLFMSGYVQDALERQGLGSVGEVFLHKPFSGADLVRKVRHVLDAGRS